MSGTGSAFGESTWTRFGGADPSSVVRRAGREPFAGTPANCALFDGIQPVDYSRILTLGRIREYTRGETLCVEGDPIQQVSLITAGAVKTIQVGSGGMEVILRLSVPGDVIGALSLASTGRHCRTAQAFRMCRTLSWDAPVFRSLAERFPQLHQNLLQIVRTDLRELEDRFREIATERVGVRLARQLTRLRDKIGQPVDGAIEIGLSREDLAQMTGTTLFTVSRVLSSWEASGAISSRREAVVIRDFQSLLALAGQS